MKRTDDFEIPASTKADILALLGLSKRPTMRQRLANLTGGLGLETIVEAIRVGLVLLFAPRKTPRAVRHVVASRQLN